MRCCGALIVLTTSLLLSLGAAAQCTAHDLQYRANPAIVRDVAISGTRTLSSDELRAIVGKLVGRCVDKDEKLASYLQNTIIDAFQRQGFFKVALKDPVEISTGDVLSKPISLQVRVSVNEGDRYRFGNVEFHGNKVFGADALRRFLPLKTGDIFDIEKVREALEAFRKLYGDQGYVNFTPVPDTKFNETDHTISLFIDLDEGQQFRVGHFEVAAVPALAQPLLRDWKLKTGDIYDASVVGAFLVQHSDVLQPNSLQIKQNTNSATVDVRIVICPPDYYCFDR